MPGALSEFDLLPEDALSAFNRGRALANARRPVGNVATPTASWLQPGSFNAPDNAPAQAPPGGQLDTPDPLQTSFDSAGPLANLPRPRRIAPMNPIAPSTPTPVPVPVPNGANGPNPITDNTPPPPDRPGFLTNVLNTLDRGRNFVDSLLAGEGSKALRSLPFGGYDPNVDRTSGQDVIHAWTGADENNSLLSPMGGAGLGVELLTDPLNYLGVGELSDAGKAASVVAGHLDEAKSIINGFERDVAGATREGLTAAEAGIEAPVHPLMGALIDAKGAPVSEPELVGRLAANDNAAGAAAQTVIQHADATGKPLTDLIRPAGNAGDEADLGQRALLSTSGEADPLGLFRLGGKFNLLNHLPEVPLLTAPLELPQQSLIQGGPLMDTAQAAWQRAKNLPGIKQAGELLGRVPDAPGGKVLAELLRTSRGRNATGAAGVAESAADVAEQLGKLPEPATWPPRAAETPVPTLPTPPAGPTPGMAKQLTQLEYTPDDIARLSFDEAHEIINNGEVKPEATVFEQPDGISPAKALSDKAPGDVEPLPETAAPAPSPAAAAEMGNVSKTPISELPPALSSAKPGYGYGAKNFKLDFESDVDKALFIVAQNKPSKSDAKYMAFLQAALPGKADDELRALGADVKARIKPLARDAEKGGVLKIPDGNAGAPPLASAEDLFPPPARAETATPPPADRIMGAPLENQLPPLEPPPPKASSAGAAGGDEVGVLPTSDIHADPERFQYKVGTGKGGVSGSLSGAKFNRDLSGTLDVWRDPANQKAYVVNGHNRLSLAKAASEPSMRVRYIDAATAAEARTRGALYNIAEGRGTAIDAATFFRETGADADKLRDLGLRASDKLTNDGLALSKLAPDIFREVAAGRFPQERGVIIGARLPGHDEQRSLVQFLSKRPKTKDAVVAEMADLAAGAPKRTVIDEDIFGKTEREQNLFLEKATLQAAVREDLARAGRTFNFVGKDERATEIAGKGVGKIDAKKARKLAEESADQVYLFDKWKQSKLAALMDEGAARIGAGENAKSVTAEIKRRARETLSSPDSGAVGSRAERVADQTPRGRNQAVESSPPRSSDAAVSSPGAPLNEFQPIPESPRVVEQGNLLGEPAPPTKLEAARDALQKAEAKTGVKPTALNPLEPIAGKPYTPSAEFPKNPSFTWDELQQMQRELGGAGEADRVHDIAADADMEPLPESDGAEKHTARLEDARAKWLEAKQSGDAEAEKRAWEHVQGVKARASFSRGFGRASQEAAAVDRYLGQAGKGSGSVARRAASFPDASPEVKRAVGEVVERGIKAGDTPEAVAAVAQRIKSTTDGWLKAEQQAGLKTPELNSDRIEYLPHVATNKSVWNKLAKNPEMQAKLFAQWEAQRAAAGLGLNPDALKPLIEQKLLARQGLTEPKSILTDLQRKVLGKRGPVSAGINFNLQPENVREYLNDARLRKDFGEFSRQIRPFHESQIPRMAATKHLTTAELNDGAMQAIGKPLFGEDPARAFAVRGFRHERSMAAAEFHAAAGHALVKDGIGREIENPRGIETKDGVTTYDTPEGQQFGVDEMNEQRVRRGEKVIAFDDPETARAIKQYAQKFRPEELSTFGRWYDQMTDGIKSYMTNFPASKVRNHIMNRVQSWLTGVPLSGEHYELANKLSAGKDFEALIDGQTMSADALRKEATGIGVVEGGFYDELFKDALADRGIEAPARERNWKLIEGGALSADNELTRSMGRVSSLVAGAPGQLMAGGKLRDIDASLVENSDRLGHYLYRRMNGWSKTAAAEDVTKALFDYSRRAMTPFERTYLSRADFFYGYTRGVIPLVAKTLVENVSKLKQLGQLGLAGPGRPKYVPEYARGGLSVPLGKDAQGNTKEAYTLETPLEAAAEPLDTNPLTELNPLLRAPLEFASGQDFFLREPIEDARKAPHWAGDLPQSLQDALGVVHIPTKSGIDKLEANPWALWALRNSPASTLSNTLSRAVDERKDPLDIASNLLTGSHIISVDEQDEQERREKDALRAQLSVLVRQGKAYSPNIVVPNRAAGPAAKAQVGALNAALRSGVK